MSSPAPPPPQDKNVSPDIEQLLNLLRPQIEDFLARQQQEPPSQSSKQPLAKHPIQPSSQPTSQPSSQPSTQPSSQLTRQPWSQEEVEKVKRQVKKQWDKMGDNLIKHTPKDSATMMEGGKPFYQPSSRPSSQPPSRAEGW